MFETRSKEVSSFKMQCEIAVFGAGPAGLAAAISSAESGRKTVLFEKNGYLGGTLASGIAPLGFLAENGEQCIAGFAQRFIDRLKERGESFDHRVCPKHNSVTGVHSEAVKLMAIRMCMEAGVEVVLHCEPLEVLCSGSSISKVILYGKGNTIEVQSDVFIDCTGDGDLAYLAGCSYEKSPVLQPPTVVFTLENVDTDKLFDYVEQHPEELRLNKAMDVKQGYNAQYFKADRNFTFVGMSALFDKLRSSGELPVPRENMIILGSVNPGEVYVNTSRVNNIDATSLKDMTRAELEGHLQVEKLLDVFHKHVPGFEKCFISSICPNLGVRETRRFKGIKTLTMDDIGKNPEPFDTISLSGGKIDIHSGADNTTQFKSVRQPFGIPYGCLVSADKDNLLLAGRCISTDTKANASLRLMPSCMALGQAAAAGAAVALEDKAALKDADVGKIRKRLLSQGAILSMSKGRK